MMKTLAFCMLLLAFGAAFEMYDENRAFEMDHGGDENYNAETYDYQELGRYWPGIREDAAPNLMLNQLFNWLQNKDDARLHMRYRPKYSVVDNPLAGYGHVPYYDVDYKNVMAKRHAGNTYRKVKPETPIPAQDDVKIVRKGY